jgi:SAM-dependent methyltransferase
MEFSSVSRYSGLVCPLCGQAIIVNLAAETVKACEHFPAARVQDGVVALLEAHDFYEGRFTGTDSFVLPKRTGRFSRLLCYARHSSLVNANGFFLWKWLERLSRKRENLRLLDVGCGSGKLLVAQYGEVHGIDYSVASLVQNRGVYTEVIQCSATTVPYPSSYFDVILSDNVLGHVPYEEKDEVISEMARLLKPGGMTIHIAEAMCIEYSVMEKLDPEAFQVNCIDHDGHVGLEVGADIDGRFVRAGLHRLYAEHGHILATARRYAEHYGGVYAQNHPLLRPAVWCARTIADNRLLAALFDRFMRLGNAVLRVLTPLKVPAGCLFWGVYEKSET